MEQNGCELKPRLHDTTCFQTGWMFVYTIQPVVKPVVQPVDNRLDKQWLFVQHVCPSGLSNRLYNPIWQPVWQPVVSCKGGIRPIVSDCKRMKQPAIQPFRSFRGPRWCKRLIGRTLNWAVHNKDARRNNSAQSARRHHGAYCSPHFFTRRLCSFAACTVAACLSQKHI